MKSTNNVDFEKFSIIPNIFFDYWLFHLTPSQSLILLAMCRVTYNSHGEDIIITKGIIEKMTAISRQTLDVSLNKLKNLGLIKQEEFLYFINQDTLFNPAHVFANNLLNINY